MVWDTELLGSYIGVYVSYGLRVCMTEILLAQNIWYWTVEFVVSTVQVARKIGNKMANWLWWKALRGELGSFNTVKNARHNALLRSHKLTILHTYFYPIFHTVLPQNSILYYFQFTLLISGAQNLYFRVYFIYFFLFHQFSYKHFHFVFTY
jgi:hypothetical protein